MKEDRKRMYGDTRFFGKEQKEGQGGGKRPWYKIAAVLLSIILVTGCSKLGGKLPSDNSAQISSSAAPLAFSEVLSGIFPQDKKVEYTYHGYAEYGQKLHFVSQEEKEGSLHLLYKGKVEDGYGSNGKDRSFSVTYTIDDQKVVQHTENKDPLRSQDKDGTMESLIPGKVILQLPLSKGNSWTQTFVWQDQTYTATSTITSIGKTPEGSAYYEVKTQVPDMKVFYGGVYKEGMIFEENKGMIGFYHSIPEASVQLSSGVTSTEDMYVFGFSFSQTQPYKGDN